MRIVSRKQNDFFPNTDIWDVESEKIGQTFRICVSAPVMPLPPDMKLGAVYLTDAAISAGALVGALRLMGMSGEVPPLYGISIGYAPGTNPPDILQRNRDLTPTAVPDVDAALPKMFGAEGHVASGGGDAFLDFLVGEIKPLLEEAYPLDPHAGLLAGLSLGGLFTLHAFLHKPESFRRYLAISPSLWWDDRVLLKRAEKLVRERSAPEASLYLCAGELESLAHVRAQMAAMPAAVQAIIPEAMKRADMQGDMQRMGNILREGWRDGRFEIWTSVFASESHNSILGAALSRGLRTLYGTLQS